MKPYIPKNLKPYIPDKGFRSVNGVDVFIETDEEKKDKKLDEILKKINEKTHKMNRTLYYWYKMIEELKEISIAIKEYERNRVTYVPMFPKDHFGIK